jgi:hypothetical protein
MAKKNKVINNYKDFMNFRFNLNEFANDYNSKLKGGCGCSRNLKMKGGSFTTNIIDLPTFINNSLPKLKGGYSETNSSDNFNIYKLLSAPGNTYQANALITSDMTTKSYSYPTMEFNMQRSIV